MDTVTLLSLHPRGQGCPGSGGTDPSVSAALTSARDRQEREPARALRDFAGQCGVPNTTRAGRGRKPRPAGGLAEDLVPGGCAEASGQRPQAGGEASGARSVPCPLPPAPPPSLEESFLRSQAAPPGLSGTAFPAVPTRGHPVVRVWGSPRQLTCAEPTGPGQWGPRAGSQARGGLEALCGMGGAPAMQGQGELGEGLPRPLTFSVGPRPEPGTTPLRIWSPSDLTRGAAKPFSGRARPC